MLTFQALLRPLTFYCECCREVCLRVLGWVSAQRVLGWASGLQDSSPRRDMCSSMKTMTRSSNLSFLFHYFSSLFICSQHWFLIFSLKNLPFGDGLSCSTKPLCFYSKIIEAEHFISKDIYLLPHLKIFIFILCLWIFFSCVYICVQHVCSACGDQRRASDPLNLELQILVICHVGAGDRIRCS